MLLTENEQLNSDWVGVLEVNNKPLVCGCGVEMELESVDGVFVGLGSETAYWVQCPFCGAAGPVEDSPTTAKFAFIEESNNDLGELDKAIVSGLSEAWGTMI